MYKLFSCLLLALAGALPAAHAALPADELAIRFLALETPAQSGDDNNAYVDLGSVAADPQSSRGRGIVIHRRVAVQLDGLPGSTATARLSVAMTSETPGCTVRVDGIAVSTIARVIAPLHRIGAPVAHDIEVVIPANVPAGPFLNALQWTAESN